VGSETSPDEGAVGGGGGGTLEPVLPAVDSGRGSEFIAADGEMRLVKMAAGMVRWWWYYCYCVLPLRPA